MKKKPKKPRVKRCRRCGKPLPPSSRRTLCKECRTRPKKLSKKQRRTMDRFYKGLKESRVKKAVQAEKHDLIHGLRPTFKKQKRTSVAKQTSLNTWWEADAHNQAKILFSPVVKGKTYRIREGKDKGKIVNAAYVNRSVAARKYWRQIEFLKRNLNQSTKMARQAFRMFREQGLLEHFGIMYDY